MSLSLSLSQTHCFFCVNYYHTTVLLFLYVVQEHHLVAECFSEGFIQERFSEGCTTGNCIVWSVLWLELGLGLGLRSVRVMISVRLGLELVCSSTMAIY